MLSQGVTTSLTLGTPPAAESPTVHQSTPTIQNPTPSHQRPTKDRWLEHQVSQKFMLSCENYDHATRVLKCFVIRRHDDQHIFDQIELFDMLFIATNYYFDSKEIPLMFQCKNIDIFLNRHTNLQSSFKED